MPSFYHAFALAGNGGRKSGSLLRSAGTEIRGLYLEATLADIAGSAAFRAGPDSDFMTGRPLVVEDGDIMH